MKNKHVKQMMFDIGALDVEVFLDTYMVSNIKGKHSNHYLTSICHVLDGAVRRGWLRPKITEYEIISVTPQDSTEDQKNLKGVSTS